MSFDAARTPILIACRDRVEPLRQLVRWLERAGHERIVLIDNDSSFEPLLAYFEECPHEVLRLGRNVGHRAVWDAGVLDTIRHDGPFVVSDCDIVPDDGSPLDAVDHFADLLMRYADVDKVGFGLRIDDLPRTYAFRDEAIAWESQFWEHEIESGVFRAEIDTTFALYRATAPAGSRRALRTGPPYVARHLSWYVDSAHLSAEEQHYRAHVRPGVSHWSVDTLPDNLQRALEARREATDRSASSAPKPDSTITIHVPGLGVGITFVRTDQEGGFWELFEDGRWEPETIALLVGLLEPGRTFVDVGAWIGPLALVAAKRGATVTAYEPDPVALAVLGSNLQLNPDVAGCITVVARALGTSNESVSLASSKLGNSMSSLAHGGAESVSVAALDAKEWSATSAFLTADVLKIDIEGAEFAVIPRMRRAFRVRRPVLLISVHGYHFWGRFSGLPKPARSLLQRALSAPRRMRLLLATRRYATRWCWSSTAAAWQRITVKGLARFVLSLADTQIVLADESVPALAGRAGWDRLEGRVTG